MENGQKEILSEMRRLAKELRRKADALEAKCAELENALADKEEAVCLFETSPVEEIPVAADLDIDIHEAFGGDSAKAPVAVIDAMTERCPWKRDMPGTPVGDIRSAVSLNDRILFIKSLFSEDAALFHDTVERLNAFGSFAEAEEWITDSFPGWDYGSDTVYRFMMAVRRKLK